LLLESNADKKSIFEKDEAGQLPLHIPCQKSGPVEVVQLLLKASICDRIEQLGLTQWKSGVEELINAKMEGD
jgi:ankyrin repeat protein